MRNKTKIFLIIGSFLLLIPFRLPISVLLIKMFNALAQLEGTILPKDVLLPNVLLTKGIYNLILSSLSVYNIEKLSRSILNRLPRESRYGRYDDKPFFWWTFLIGLGLFFYIIFDIVNTADLFKYLFK